MNFKNVKYMEKANKHAHTDTLKMGIIIIFIIFIAALAIINGPTHANLVLILSAIIGGYMALSIGANDVANNLGPAVGSGAVSLLGAIFIAAVCEASGSLIAGASVVNTIKSNIITPTLLRDSNAVLSIMISALLAGAIWLHLATIFKAPVSTTHSIVGGIMGSGIAYGGFSALNIAPLLKIVASWVISPMLGGLIAALFLYFIKRTITYKEDRLGAGGRVVPYLIGVMSFIFISYLILKGLKHMVHLPLYLVFIIALALALVIYAIVAPYIAKKVKGMEDSKESINALFGIPLIFAAALLSFAHGANDVANAIGPLAAISSAIMSVASKANAIPLWIMLIGALGIALGLALYGPRLIKTVGGEITELDKMRAFCIAMSSALTVLVASQLGLPVSSTHIAIGAIFGIGFLREYLKGRYKRAEAAIIEANKDKDETELKDFLARFRNASIAKKRKILRALKRKEESVELGKKDRKKLKRIYKENLVKRTLIIKIVASWIITVPFSALLSALIYYLLVHFDILNKL